MTETQTILKAEELRIGNWIQLNNDFIQIKNVAVEGVNVSGGYDGELIGEDYEEIQPISLTPEILEKAGFTVGGYLQEYYHDLPCESGETFLSWSKNYQEVYLVMMDSHYSIDSAKAKYLHQLQNLFYCLVGKELEINL